MRCKGIGIVLGIIIGVTMTSSLVEAETIVHSERSYREARKSSEETRSQEKNHAAGSHENIAAVDAGEADRGSENRTASKEKDTLEDKSAEIVKEHPVTSEHYFDSFEKIGPDFEVSFGEGGDLAGTSSIHFCSSKFIVKNTDTNENVTFMVSKIREAWLFGADTMLFIACTWDLKAPTIVGQNRYPLFEMNMNGEKEIIKLQKLSQYSRKSFSVSTGNVHFLDSLYGRAGKVTMLLPLTDGNMARIPIPAEVIEQWEEVSNADLKKMRREYDRE